MKATPQYIARLVRFAAEQGIRADVTERGDLLCESVAVSRGGMPLVTLDYVPATTTALFAYLGY